MVVEVIVTAGAGSSRLSHSALRPLSGTSVPEPSGSAQKQQRGWNTVGVWILSYKSVLPRNSVVSALSKRVVSPQSQREAVGCCLRTVRGGIL